MSALEQDQGPEHAMDSFAMARQDFHRMEAGLRARYKGQYVAVHQGRVLASGEDDEEIARQIYEKWGEIPFYIGKVGGEGWAYEVPSPEVIG